MNLRMTLAGAGLKPDLTIQSAQGIAAFARDRKAFLRAAQESGGEFRLGSYAPQLADREDSSGEAKGAYFHQDLLVAQEVWEKQPRRHVDIASRVDGVVAHIAAFRDVEVHDIRPLRTSARRIQFVQRDVTVPDDQYTDYADSVSCLHALEHFGLGRYGDPIDYYGYKSGLQSLVRMVEPGGRLYLSVPISKDQRIEFNAHRIFSLPYLLELVGEAGLELQRLHIVDDSGEVQIDVHEETGSIQRTFDLHHGCGILFLGKGVK